MIFNGIELNQSAKPNVKFVYIIYEKQNPICKIVDRYVKAQPLNGLKKNSKLRT